MERENQRIAITKRLIKEALLRLMKEKDVGKINVTELCREAEINRATFYRHYEIPRDVLVEIEKDLYYDLRKAVPIPQGPEQIKTSLDKMCLFMEENHSILRTLIQNSTDMDFAIFIHDIYMEVWNDVGASSVFQKYNSDDIKLITLYCAGGSYFTLRHWLLGNVRKSSGEMADYIYELLNKTDFEFLGKQLGFK